MPLVMHDKWIKELFSKPCVHTLKVYIIPSYLSVLKSQNYSTVKQLCIFQKNWRKVVLGYRGNKRASATNPVMNLSYTLYAIADAKALCTILYSSRNIQIKAAGVQWTPTQLHLVGKDLSIQRVNTLAIQQLEKNHDGRNCLWFVTMDFSLLFFNI